MSKMCSERKSVSKNCYLVRKGDSRKEVPCGFKLYYVVDFHKNKPSFKKETRFKAKVLNQRFLFFQNENTSQEILYLFSCKKQRQGINKI